MVHVYFHSLEFAHLSMDFQYVGNEVMEICYTTKV